MPLDAATTHVSRFLLQLRNRHFFVLDILLLSLVPLAALELRVDDPLSAPRYLAPLVNYTLAGLPLWLAVFMLAGLYTRNWQFASIEELGTIFKAVTIGTAVNAVLFLFVLGPLGLTGDFPRSAPVLSGILTLLAVGGTRLSVRLVESWRRRQRFAGHTYKEALVYGAGGAGALIVRELQANPQLGLNPVGFLDDDPRKTGTVIHGVRVMGGRAALAEVARDTHAELVIIAIPTAAGKTLREISAECLKHHLAVRTVPGMFELLDGSVTVNKLRPVQIEDLLRRAPVQTETGAVDALVGGKRVLVTGAGGSIGGELCRQIARRGPAVLVLLGHGENSLFEQSRELRATYPGVALETVIADVRDAPRMGAVMARVKPQLVFHAAAHKHVSLMEENVEEAVTNNVLGTRVTLDTALAAGVDVFVMVSTDKAVNPVSVMGATKRLAERYVQARALETGRRCMAVRFGNVLGSRGSVVPIFKQQIASGGPVQVTHPDVRRFFMTIPEAVQLVLQAATIGCGGEIFALDMGEPVRIVDLAQDMIRLSGLRMGPDIDIEFTGLRPGEKLEEELFVPGEAQERTSHDKIFVSRNGKAGGSGLYAALDELIACARTGSAAEVRRQLAALTGALDLRADE